MTKTFVVNNEKIEIWDGNRFVQTMARSYVKEIQDDGENLIVTLNDDSRERWSKENRFLNRLYIAEHGISWLLSRSVGPNDLPWDFLLKDGDEDNLQPTDPTTPTYIYTYNCKPLSCTAAASI